MKQQKIINQSPNRRKQSAPPQKTPTRPKNHTHTPQLLQNQIIQHHNDGFGAGDLVHTKKPFSRYTYTSGRVYCSFILKAPRELELNGDSILRSQRDHQDAVAAGSCAHVLHLHYSQAPHVLYIHPYTQL